VVFVDVVLVALVVGRVLGGRLSGLAEAPIRATGLAFVAIGLQVVAFPFAWLPWQTPEHAARGLWLASYAVLIALLVLNVRLRGVALVAAGLCANLAAIVANAGLMPALPSALRAAGRSYRVHDNSIAQAHPHLAALVDRWAVPHWIPFGNVFSVGDAMIAAGILVAVVAAMRIRPAADVAVPPGRPEPQTG
jgi:Family of unknown function (DUF5317)